MNIHYDKDLDYLEVFFASVKNHEEVYGKVNGISQFKSERGDKTVGYSFEHASKTVLVFSEFDPVEKLAVLLRISRLNKNLSQDDVAKKIQVSLRHYQRLEAGQDTTLTQLNTIMKVFPETDFTSIFEHSKAS